ncbi:MULTISPECIES: TetR/AcrR family transcriptional regulator [Mycolicibacterium]|nr:MULTISPECIES: TetR/AcrR family transcriptional regulator [Mycolicibacterium]
MTEVRDSAPDGGDHSAMVLRGGTQLRRQPSPQRQERYDEEVRTLIGAAQVVMRRLGTTEVPRVVDIVVEAGMTNQAFYRHFRSRDDLIVATYEYGLLLLHGYLVHQLSRRRTPKGKLEAWITGVLAQVADPSLAETSRAILWNVNQIPTGSSEVQDVGLRRVSDLLIEPLVQSGSTDPDWDAGAISSLVMAMTNQYVADGRLPSRAEIERTRRFCLRGAGIAPGRTP